LTGILSLAGNKNKPLLPEGRSGFFLVKGEYQLRQSIRIINFTRVLGLYMQKSDKKEQPIKLAKFFQVLFLKRDKTK